MQLRATTFLVTAALCLAPAASHAALSPYSENFEALNPADAGALGNTGWLVFANVFDPAMNYLYGYGVFPAPNGSGGFCNVASGQGGAAQGAQQLVVFSDYNNQLPAGHAVGNVIEALVFQEQTIAAGDVGSTWEFQFDAKKGDIGGATTAVAFIKTLDPNNGYAQSSYIPLNTTALPTTWATYSILISIHAGLVGHIMQIGFASTATNNEPSGVLYDNINVAPGGPTPVEASTWGRVKALYR